MHFITVNVIEFMELNRNHKRSCGSRGDEPPRRATGRGTVELSLEQCQQGDHSDSKWRLIHGPHSECRAEGRGCSVGQGLPEGSFLFEVPG